MVVFRRGLEIIQKNLSLLESNVTHKCKFSLKNFHIFKSERYQYTYIFLNWVFLMIPQAPLPLKSTPIEVFDESCHIVGEAEHTYG